MENLQRKIRKLESDIQFNQKSLHANFCLLKHKIREPKFLCFALITGFVAGFLLGSEENRKAVKGRFAKAPATLLKIFEHVKVLLPLISI